MPAPPTLHRRLGSKSCVLLAGVILLAPFQAHAADKTNVVFILTDNHGAWTLGCYGNPDIRTPHIDRLAAEGIRFTRALSSNPVCSPTRATFLTGLIPSQHGVHSYLGGERPSAQMGPDAYCTIREFASLPKILKQAGYVCGLSGKWHLGANLTPQEGFSDWITMPHGHTTEFYDAQVIENGEVRTEPKYLTDLWTEHGVRFIEENKDRPFFLYLAYNGPYALGRLLLNPARNRHAEYYADKELLSFPRDAMHPWQFNNKEFLNNPVSIRRVAAEVSGVDDGVGEILATLQRLRIGRAARWSCLPADQGWMGGQNGLWGMGDHTRPDRRHELMMQIPLDLPALRQDPGRPDQRLAGQQLRLPADGAPLSGLERQDAPAVARPRFFGGAARGSDLLLGQRHVLRNGKHPGDPHGRLEVRRAAARRALSSCTTCRRIRRSDSTCSASPPWRTSSANSPPNWTPSSPAMPTRSTTSGKAAAPKPDDWAVRAAKRRRSRVPDAACARDHCAAAGLPI